MWPISPRTRVHVKHPRPKRSVLKPPFFLLLCRLSPSPPFPTHHTHHHRARHHLRCRLVTRKVHADVPSSFPPSNHCAGCPTTLHSFHHHALTFPSPPQPQPHQPHQKQTMDVDENPPTPTPTVYVNNINERIRGGTSTIHPHTHTNTQSHSHSRTQPTPTSISHPPPHTQRSCCGACDKPLGCTAKFTKSTPASRSSCAARPLWCTRT